jgi:hypothetical protein
MGDATNLILIFAGELLKRSEYLLTMGLHPSDVIQGFEMALTKGREELASEQIWICGGGSVLNTQPSLPLLSLPLLSPTLNSSPVLSLLPSLPSNPVLNIFSHN